jgi:hypothetical protein
MKQLDVPIIAKTYDLYLTLYQLEKSIQKNVRYTLWQKIQNLNLQILENLVLLGYLPQESRLSDLKKTSARLDLIRILVRMACDIKSINTKKYLSIQENIDEIGRMLGGWIKSLEVKK